jgi:ATP-dependent helicase/nuclease subunit A
MQGSIDCLYQDAVGDWRILDYKTAAGRAANDAVDAARYEMQLGVYALAAEKALGVAPVERVIYFLHAGVERVLPWNDESRYDTITRVSAAMKTANG